MGADLNSFAYCVLALTLLTGGGIWALNPARIHGHDQLADPTPPRSDQPPAAWVSIGWYSAHAAAVDRLALKRHGDNSKKPPPRRLASMRFVPINTRTGETCNE